VADVLPPTAIFTTQGAAHGSALVGQAVRSAGIFTAIDSDGYYLQGATRMATIVPPTPSSSSPADVLRSRFRSQLVSCRFRRRHA
jgi:hypothetical protein